jgi:superfamily I DNA and/or RNA helicase/very-short-patch-repair endonuclease
LNYKPSKRRTVEIKNENIVEIYDILVIQEKTMRFKADPNAVKNTKAGKENAADAVSLEEDEDSGFLKNLLKKTEGEGSAAVGLETPYHADELEERLFYTNNQSIAVFEEQGYPILYLAAGFLQWTDGSKKSFKAPLILIPVQFKRVGPKRRFIVQWTGGDIFASITLKAKLMEFDLELPEFFGADDKGAVEFYLKAVDDLISEKKDWAIIREANIDFYDFKKFVMYKDLDPKIWPEGQGPETHPLINQVFNPSAENDGGGFSENEVDLKLSTDSVYHIVNADSSQISVIEDVKAGRNLVVEGPPGTGKSQTITNLIAELLMSGKSVLFVSEKMAALQVVKKRLDAAGLGDLVLEIHSHKAQKKAVLDELERTLKRQPPAEKNYAQDLAELENLKYELNEYSKTLSQTVGPIGHTVYDIYGIREDVTHYFNINKRKMAHIEFKSPERWDRKQWAEAVSILEKIGDALPSIGGVKENPWRDVRPGIILPPDLQEIERVLEDASRWSEIISESVDVIVSETGLNPPASLNNLEQFTGSIETFKNAPKISRNVLKNQSVKERGAQKELIKKARRRNELEQRIEEIFTSRIFEEDIDTYLKKAGKIMKFMDGGFKDSKTKISECYIKRAVKSDADIKKDVLLVQEFNDLERELENAKQKALLLFGSHWEAGRADPQRLDAFYDWIVLFDVLESGGNVTDETYACIERGINGSVLEEAVEKIRKEQEYLDAALIKLVNSVGADPDLFFNEKSVKEILPENESKIEIAAPDNFEEGGGLIKAEEPDEPDAVKIPLKRKFERAAAEKVFRETLTAKQLSNILRVWSSDLPSLVLWSQFLLYREKCLETVAAPMILSINENEVLPEDLVPAFKGNYADGVLRAEFMKKRVLSTFIKEVHENKIHKFSELDEKVIVKNRERVNAEIYRRMPQIYVGASRESEAGILLNEFNKKKAHMPIRRLMSNAGGLIQKIKPCFMMSSLSIAQYLEPQNTSFDVVIFDEASQVRPEDALGALLRGRRVVVMGDSKQLPPTTFFENMMEAEEEYNEDGSFYSDVESVLNICKRSFPYKTLRWHYRSRHESLIAVSNNEFYGNHLYVYPSPLHEDKNTGLQFRHVRNSVYERGKTGVNREEARVVAQEVMRHFIQFPDKTLMVGTFNVKQQEAIQKEVESLVKSSPGFEKYFTNEKGENFMVKNIETIQGDERDVIFVSIGFGFDQEGRLSKNFGPLNRDGGERRLNVLFTRAREKCVIFSNFTSADLHAGDDDPAGLRVLKSFLEYAETKSFVSKTPDYEPDEVTFDESVAVFLRENGFTIHQKIGCAGYKMDIAVVNEELLGHYIIGIETDGPQYFNSRVARDRDRLRNDVLTGLGWQLCRVWSTDWYLNPQKAKKNLLDAIEKAKESAKKIEAPVQFEFDEEEVTVTVTDEKEIEKMIQIINEREAQSRRKAKERSEAAEKTAEMKDAPEKTDEETRTTAAETETAAEEINTVEESAAEEETVTEPEETPEMIQEETPIIEESTETAEETETAAEPQETVSEPADEEIVEFRPEKEKPVKPKKEKAVKSAQEPENEPAAGNSDDTGSSGPEDHDADDEYDLLFGDIRKMPADITDEQIFDVGPLIQDGIPTYVPYSKIDLPSTENLLEIPRHKMEHEIVEIVSHEGPVHKEQLILEIKQRCDTKRLTKAMRDMIIHEISSAEKSNYIRVRGNFLWPVKVKGCIVRKREGDLLNIDWISEDEILQAAVYVLKTQYSTPLDQLVKRASQIFGFKIMRPAVKEKIESVINKAAADGRIVSLPNGKIYLDE